MTTINPITRMTDAEVTAWADARDRRQTHGEPGLRDNRFRMIGPAKLPATYDGRLTRRLRALRAKPTPLSDLPAGYWDNIE